MSTCAYAWWRLGQLYELQQNPENNRAQKAPNNFEKYL